MAFDSLPMRPPVRPMLARLVRGIPEGDFVYEPKWDGFRALVFVDGDSVEVQSRHGRPFARYFPDVTDAVRSLGLQAAILDGEIVVMREGRFDFETLMLRLHPAATRIEALSRQTPATFIAFDLLAGPDGTSLLDAPFVERRRRLAAAVAPAATSIQLTPATDDPDTADDWLHRFAGGGVAAWSPSCGRACIPPGGGPCSR